MKPAARVMGLALVLLTTGAAGAVEERAATEIAAVPFRVSGTLISPPTRIALVVLLDEQGKATGEVKLHEGDIFEGYRLVSIEAHEVVFEQRGRTVSVKVGNDLPAAPTSAVVPVIPHERTKPRPGTIIPPPDNIEEIRRQTETFLEQLRQNAEFQKGLDAVKERFNERVGAPPTKP